MRIHRVSIGQFGALRDRSFELSEGMTVFHGPNESGKTTTMEFIRTVLVPTNKRNVYPERTRRDSGSISYEEDGAEKVVSLDGKARSGDVPRLPAGADDPELYRSVFAMDQRGLDDDGMVRGELRSRFLTVPGGDRMAAAVRDLDEESASLMGKSSRSPSRVNSAAARVKGNADRVAEARGRVGAYGTLCEQRDGLRQRLQSLREAGRASAEDRRVRQLYDSQKGNYEALEGYGRELASLGSFPEVAVDDVERREALSGELSRRQASYDTLNGQREGLKQEMMGADRRMVTQQASRIDALPGRLEAYREAGRRLSEPVRPPQRREPETLRTTRVNPLVYIGAILAVVGLAGVLVTPYAVALTAAGAVLAVVGLRRPVVRTVTSGEPAPVRDTDAEERARAESTVRGFESEVSGIMAALGLPQRGAEPDVDTLVRVRRAAEAYGRLDSEMMKAQLSRKEAEAELLRFDARFGGEEGFRDALARSRRAAELRSRISTTRATIERSGLDPDVPVCPVEAADDPGTGEIEEVSRAIGELEQRMSAILEEGEVERLMDEGTSLEAELARALEDGAVALLARSIAEDACADAYSTVRPGVVATADRYLGMMTDGMYSVDTNPMSPELSVRCGETVRPAGQWSSGLRAQVLLSVKLAVAREMGGGEVPVILDDVLLPFDSERKAGACRALAELSGEMQVLLFTCDRETAEICRGLQGVRLLEMG